ncbi:hypothetical protein DB895_07425 [Flavobacterium psychrotolerans]|uniref:Uncharacterized protein n=1 Tax=Flavobacterium psychrotolerans TaxID=2169410 RepID=A0A2U1JKL5_9FLAO|nr:hypothetical protein DB895_07425 [Flavobacterium psychrotolerans]
MVFLLPSNSDTILSFAFSSKPNFLNSSPVKKPLYVSKFLKILSFVTLVKSAPFLVKIPVGCNSKLFNF